MPQRLAQLPRVIARDVRPEIAVGPTLVALVTHLFGHVQNDGDALHEIAFGERQKRRARFFLHVGRINYGQFAIFQAQRRNFVN